MKSDSIPLNKGSLFIKVRIDVKIIFDDKIPMQTSEKLMNMPPVIPISEAPPQADRRPPTADDRTLPIDTGSNLQDNNRQSLSPELEFESFPDWLKECFRNERKYLRESGRVKTLYVLSRRDKYGY